ncbi:MAG: leucine-rich repeat protein [Alistipes sp.]|nr:leucine-rich repeat protein [Alistipes sp.]
MKHKLLLTLGVAAMAFAGCTADVEVITPMPSPDGASHKVLIEGNIDQRDNTRVDDSGFCVGDVVGIYLVNYDGDTPGTLLLEDNQADNVKFTLAEDDTWDSEYDIYYKDDDTKVDFFGYYPYAQPSSIEAYPFEVAKDQTKEAEHGQMATYEASDFLWAKAENITPTENRVAMRFQHKMSSVRVRLVQGDGWADEAEFAAVKKEILVSNTIRKSTINLATGEVTPTGDVPLDGIIPVKDGDAFRAIVVPQSVAAGENVLVITIDGHPRFFARNEVTEYLPGKITTFDLKIKKTANTGDYELELVGFSIMDWEADNVSHQDDAREYVVVHCPIAGQLERTIVDRLEMDVTAIKNLKLTGAIGKEDYYFMRDKMTSLMRLNLKEVESLIDGVYQIPERAFDDKKTLIKCVLPDKLEHIEYHAFCSTSLTGTLQLPEGLKYVSGFEDTKITNVQFPSTLEEIGPNAFYRCTSLMCEISLPASLKRIGGNAFYYSGIKGNLVLSEGIEEIGVSAFEKCVGLTGSLTIPSGIKIIESLCFFNCSGFNGNLTLPMGLTEIKWDAFCGTNFKGELNIPSTVRIIGEDAFSGTEFNGTLVLPKELISLGSGAFRGCWRLSGVVEIPENIVAIPSQLFYDCKNIEGIVLHKDVEVIEEGAFGNCFYVSSIVSEAKNPPTIASDSFSGVAKDNFTLEVPEESIKKYQFASGWSEFKRIAAHREFSISRNLLRTLNNQHSKTFVMRAPAGEAWSVESAPEWVTVTPSSGVGKVDVTITVNEMSAGDVGTFQTGTVNSSGKVTYSTHAGRGGEVVFLLDGKDYRTRMTVEQYDYEYGDGDLITLQEKGVGNGVNIVLMGDCFDAKDISEGKYIKAMQDAYTYFFDIEPYLSYKDYFNVYAVVGMSADSGMGTVNTIREARFGSQYTLNEGVSPDFETVFAGACMAPINDNVATTLVILVENSYEYSGLCYMWGDGSAVAVVPISTDPAPYDFRGLIHHEAGGHGFGKLADEYIYYNSFIPIRDTDCGGQEKVLKMKSYGFYSNISLTGSMQEVPWSHMIYDPQYSNVVDVYEGAYMHTRGVWRSEATSCMNNNIAYYNAISREAMVKRIMKYAGEEYSYEAFKALDHESLPSTSATRAWEWDGLNFVTSSQFDQRPPKFMGEKPVFDKSKF